MKENMDDGEIELPDHVWLPNSDSSSNIQASLSGDSFLDDILLGNHPQTCTHTHTCNPPGPVAAHTHTCYHTHTNLIPSEARDKQSPVSKTRPLGNREAVRKYREKKKAQAAYLEEEVKKLRHVNKLLMVKLQRQAILETEILRLRSLLFELRGEIDNELGDFPFGKQCDSIGTLKEGGCGVQPSSVNDLGCSLAGSFDCEANVNDIGSGEKCLRDSLETLVPSSPSRG